MSIAETRAAQAQARFAPPELEALRSPKILIREGLAGTVTRLALIPEVISFSFVSGADPKVALIASIVLALTMSVLGGRPAMVTAAAASVALVIGPMVKAHGVPYVLPTIVLAGIVQPRRDQLRKQRVHLTDRLHLYRRRGTYIEDEVPLRPRRRSLTGVNPPS